jgi:uncharacterized protein (DUF1499 family)/multisubunit Na+/H+ antiporter MnhC subunit
MPESALGNKCRVQVGDPSMSTTAFPSLHPPRWPGRVTRLGLWILGAGLLVAGSAGPLNRFALTSVSVALLTLMAGFVVIVAGTAITIIGVLFGTAKRAPIPGTAAVVGIVIGLALTAYMTSWIYRAQHTPPINDITTDPADPPKFVAVIPLRQRAHATVSAHYIREERLGDKTIDVPALQQKYYPYIKPLFMSLPPAQALAKARRVAQALGWRIDAYVPADGRLEATAHTFFFDFKDDVVVRVRPHGSGSRIDVRSESRVGVGDVGTNAARIRAFLDRMKAP